MANEVDYPFVRRWGQLLGSHEYYIEDQVETPGSMVRQPTRSTGIATVRGTR
jgi:hypothetical protein